MLQRDHNQALTSWYNCTPCPMPRQAILLLHPELCCRGQSALQLPHIFDWICTQTIALWIVLLTGCVHTPWYHILSYYPESFSIHYGTNITDHPLSTILYDVSYLIYHLLYYCSILYSHIIYCPTLHYSARDHIHRIACLISNIPILSSFESLYLIQPEINRSLHIFGISFKWDCLLCLAQKSHFLRTIAFNMYKFVSRQFYTARRMDDRWRLSDPVILCS